MSYQRRTRKAGVSVSGGKEVSKRKRRRKKNKTLNVLAIAILSVVIAFVWSYINPNGHIPTAVITSDTDVTVHFIDVGQGDCELILDHGEAILIDAGENDQGEAVVRYLRSCGVNHLKLAVGTHPHSDHIGGMDTVLENIPTDELLLPNVSEECVPTTRTYQEVLEAADENGTRISWAESGTEYTVGEGILYVLGPVADDYTELNSWSVPMRYCYQNTSFFFGGDIEKDAEKDLLASGQNLQSTIMKLNHHGSNTSNTEEFLRAVNPQAYVIEVGAGNSYNLPSDKVIARLGTTPVYRTDRDGTIVFGTDGNTLQVMTENG